MNIIKKSSPRKFSDEKKRIGDHYQHRERRKINEKEKRRQAESWEF